MAIGLLLGRMFGGLTDTLETINIDTVSLPIAIGLLAIMYPVLAKVKYSKIGEVTADRRLKGTSLFLNWVVGPLVMFALAGYCSPTSPPTAPA